MSHTIHHQHRQWSPEQAPALHVAPGDTVTLVLQDASGNRIARDADAAIIETLNASEANPLTGPVHVEGAEPGDVLVVDILDFEQSAHGWTAIIPGLGLLSDRFSQPYLHHSDYDADRVYFTDDIVLPARPFAGTIGVCPTSDCLSIIPHACGGNLDYQDLRAGSRLFFPVSQPGALFSAGDGHAAQGDGEVCGTAVETRLTLSVRFSLIRQQPQPAPMARVTLPARPATESHVTMGVGPDLLQASRDAVSFMVDVLVREYRLEPELAYCLCSCAGNLRIAEVVNAPNWTVVFELPLDIFT